MEHGGTGEARLDARVRTREASLKMASLARGAMAEQTDALTSSYALRKCKLHTMSERETG
jgi:hypothetical protein